MRTKLPIIRLKKGDFDFRDLRKFNNTNIKHKGGKK